MLKALSGVFENKKGLKTAYNYIKVSEASTAPLLIFLHGYMSSKDSEKGQKLASFAEKSGLDFLSYTAYGKIFKHTNILGTEGSSMEMREVSMSDRIAQIEDLLSDFILKQKDYKKIILAGHSLGGYTASILIRDSQLLRERLAGALILCPAIEFPFHYLKYLKPE